MSQTSEAKVDDVVEDVSVPKPRKRKQVGFRDHKQSQLQGSKMPTIVETGRQNRRNTAPTSTKTARKRTESRTNNLSVLTALSDMSSKQSLSETFMSEPTVPR